MTEPVQDLSRLRIEREQRSGVGRGGWLAFALLLLAGMAAFGWQALARFRHARPRVEVVRVQRRGGVQAQSGVAANGYVVARRRAALSTDIQGRVVAITVEEGARVRQGDLIARLDTSQLEAALARTHADLGRAEAASALARLTAERAGALARSGHMALAERDQAAASLEEARATVRSLAAAEKEIRTQISKSFVFAPFAGVIVAKNAEVGEVVSSLGAGGGANARGSVATLVDFDTLEVQVELAQTSLQAAREGAPVLIYLDAYPERAYRGRVRQIWPTADRQKATVELRAEFLERDQRILPEMGARVVFVPEAAAEPQAPEVLAPKRALAGGADAYVLIYNPRGSQDGAASAGSGAGTVTRRRVEVAGAGKDGLVPIHSGLQGNELVVLDPGPSLGDGDEVLRKED